MKCKSCRADYKLKDPECPYCGRENKLGKYWSWQENTAQKRYERTKEEVIKSGPLYVADKILNGIIGVMLALFVLSVVIAFVAYYIEEGISKAKKSTVSEEEIQTLYNAEDYNSLYDYMSEYEVLNEEAYFVYGQAAFMYKKWEKFVEQRMEFQEAELEDIENSPKYGLVYGCMNSASEIYLQEWSSKHKGVLPENQEYYEWMCMEADAFLIGELGMTHEEVASMRELESYRDEWKVLQRSIFNRNGWQWREDNE